MKKIIAMLMAVVVLASTAVIGVSAATKSDVLSEAAKIPVYKYIKVAVENAARTVTITDEQAEKLLPIVKKIAQIITTDKGPTVAANESFYTVDEIYGVLDCIDEACAIMGYTYKMLPVANPKHNGDIIFTVYDSSGKVIFEYDGDVVADTDAATVADTAALLGGAGFMLVLGAAAIAVSKKRIAAR